jgi:uncharacterized OsmC-like protein
MSISEAIENTRQAIEADPANAAVTLRVNGENVSPTEFAARAGRHRVTIDQPGPLGGDDKGAGPTEYALLALASCQAVITSFWAAKLGIELEGLEVSVEGDLDVRGFLGFDDSVRPGFSDIRVEIAPRGPETADRYQELAEAVDAHCPVLDLFTNGTQVSTRLAVPTA